MPLHRGRIGETGLGRHATPDHIPKIGADPIWSPGRQIMAADAKLHLGLARVQIGGGEQRAKVNDRFNRAF